jgi:hypothetical protein
MLVTFRRMIEREWNESNSKIAHDTTQTHMRYQEAAKHMHLTVNIRIQSFNVKSHTDHSDAAVSKSSRHNVI